MNDGEITEIINTANKTEIKAAKESKPIAADPHVKDFAKHMIEEHVKNQKEVKNSPEKRRLKPTSVRTQKRFNRTLTK